MRVVRNFARNFEAFRQPTIWSGSSTHSMRTARPVGLLSESEGNNVDEAEELHISACIHV